MTLTFNTPQKIKTYQIKVFGYYVLYVFLGEYSGWFRVFGYGMKWKDKSKKNLTFSQRNGHEKYWETKKHYIGILKKGQP